MEEALAKLKAGDETLEELNLNNHQEVTEDILMDIVEHLKNNSSLKRLLLANTQMKDHVGEVWKNLFDPSIIQMYCCYFQACHMLVETPLPCPLPAFNLFGRKDP